MPKTRSTDQPLLAARVVNFVSQFVPDFSSDDIQYVRSMRSPEVSIFNVHCRSVTRATLVKSTFASLVKSDDPPEYLGDVSISYSHSLGTRIRLSLMRSISKRQREKDSKAICSVTSFTARPMMRLVIYFLSFLFLLTLDLYRGFIVWGLFRVSYNVHALSYIFYIVIFLYYFQSWDQGKRYSLPDLC